MLRSKLVLRPIFSAVLLIILLAVNCAAFAAVHGDTVSLTILSVNDFHGALADKGTGKDPGAAKLAACLLAEKAQNPTGTLILSAGDMFQGTADSNLMYGQPVLDVMNYVGFDAMALGNHEFDWGIDYLKTLKQAAKFPIGAANIHAGGVIPDFALPAAQQPYILLARDGLKIGIIPLTTPETAFKTNPKYVGGYKFDDPVKTVRTLTPKLRAKGAQVIIVLSHLGSYQDAATGQISGEAADLAKTLPTGYVDLIISGHSHMSVAGAVNNIAIVQALYSGRQVGLVALDFSTTRKRVGEVRPTVINLANMTDVAADSGAKAIVDKYATQLAPLKNTVLGVTTYDLTHDRYGRNVSILGQWATDIMKAAVNADFAFQNGGGLRTAIHAGNVTIGNLYEVMPFDNTLNTVEMTGKQIIEVLDFGLYNTTVGMLQFAGANVIYDPAQAPGSRVWSITMPDGSMLDVNKLYKVVTNDFMVAGGDGYTMFKQGKNLTETGIPVRDCLGNAVKKAGQITYTGDNRLVVR